MIRRSSVILLVLSLITSGVAVGQLPVLPLTFRPVHDVFPTVTVELSYAIGTGALSDRNALGGWISLESERFRGSVGVASLMPDGADSKFSGAVKVGYRISGLLTLTPVVAQTGIGYSIRDVAGGDIEHWEIPVGMAVGLSGILPSNLVSNVEPWIGLSGVLRAVDIGTAALNDNRLRGGAALSIGMAVGLPNGLGVHAAAQFARMRSVVLPAWDWENGFHFGAYFRL